MWSFRLHEKKYIYSDQWKNQHESLISKMWKLPQKWTKTVINCKTTDVVKCLRLVLKFNHYLIYRMFLNNRKLKKKKMFWKKTITQFKFEKPNEKDSVFVNCLEIFSWWTGVLCVLNGNKKRCHHSLTFFGRFFGINEGLCGNLRFHLLM